MGMAHGVKDIVRPKRGICEALRLNDTDHTPITDSTRHLLLCLLPSILGTDLELTAGGCGFGRESEPNSGHSEQHSLLFD